jgi:hypothetical protein
MADRVENIVNIYFKNFYEYKKSAVCKKWILKECVKALDRFTSCRYTIPIQI